MNAGDVDEDGDLVLGNFTLLGSTIQSTHDCNSAPQFLLFRNRHKTADGQLRAAARPRADRPAL